jgi:acyl-CoA dehydrogenase
MAANESHDFLRDWVADSHALGAVFRERAGKHDLEGTFVASNYRDLKTASLFSASVPTELGGGGATHGEVCQIVRILAGYCGSTALSYAMHSHPVCANVFKHRRGDEQATDSLRKIAAGQLVIAGTGANDWLMSSGEAVEVDGGFRVTADKRFVSGGPGADLFVTSAVLNGEEGQEVIHFAVPMGSAGIEIKANWDTLGMRGTGSNDVLMRDVFVPASAVVARRAAGRWHPMWDVILPIALPPIVSCYVGLAERAAELSVEACRGKAANASLVGQMNNELAIARLALNDMINTANNYDFSPHQDITAGALTRKSIAARAVKAVVECAADLTGGSGFYRGNEMERIVRDVRAFHFHPLPERYQQQFCGRIALGLDPVA